MVIYPRNNPGKVQHVLEVLGFADMADTYFRFKALDDSASNFESSITLRDLFERYLDIFGKPRRHFFQLLSFFTENEIHKEKLLEFASTEGQVIEFNQIELNNYAYRPRRTTFEVLLDFPSVKIPLNYILDIFPKMRPRHFSISSSPSKHANQIHLTVAIVDYKTSLQEKRIGVCTSWLSTLKPGGIFN